VVDVLAFLLRVHNTYQIVWPWQTARVRCEKSVIAVHHGSVARLVAPAPRRSWAIFTPERTVK
jgi:hypothetical protein